MILSHICLLKFCRYATILAFDVKIEKDAQEMADHLGVKIFQADIIYHLFDKFMAYRDELKQRKRDEFKNIAVFPCKVRVLPQVIMILVIIYKSININSTIQFLLDFSIYHVCLPFYFQFVFNSRDPIVCGVMVEAGIVREGTPICVPSKDVSLNK